MQHYMNAQAVSPVREYVGTSRQAKRRELFVAHFPSYPGFVQGKMIGNVSAHSKYGRFMPRAERRKLARAFAAGEWKKSHDVAALVP